MSAHGTPVAGFEKSLAGELRVRSLRLNGGLGAVAKLDIAHQTGLHTPVTQSSRRVGNPIAAVACLPRQAFIHNSERKDE